MIKHTVWPEVQHPAKVPMCPCACLDLEHHLGDEVLGHIQQVVVVSVGLVELHSGELRVVGHVDALISERGVGRQSSDSHRCMEMITNPSLLVPTLLSLPHLLLL